MLSHDTPDSASPEGGSAPCAYEFCWRAGFRSAGLKSAQTASVWKCLVRPEGLEPPAYWFEASRSIRLSYGREYFHYTPRAALPPCRPRVKMEVHAPWLKAHRNKKQAPRPRRPRPYPRPA